MTPVITLTTDFGSTGEYAGVMHGVILGICPDARVVDITHHAPAQDIAWAGRTLAAAWPYFPMGTVHTAVVDPGVGSGRGVLAAAHGGHVFLAPDNGLLSGILTEEARVFRVEETRFFLSKAGGTFHGRDIFAPVAAHIAGGVALEALGPAVEPDKIVRLEWRQARAEADGTLVGEVTDVDRFGNLVTNIPAEASGARGGKAGRVRIGGGRSARIVGCYAEGKPGELVAVAGSRGFWEVSVVCGSAREAVGVEAGAEVRLEAE
jgi:S-adenosylmethionine hydrolase